MNDERQDSPQPIDGRSKAVRSWRTTAEDIGRQAIRQVIEHFYEQIQEDPVLGPRFAVVSDWRKHKARLAHFWWVVLGGSAYMAYRYRVVDAHRNVGVASTEIERWMALFCDCVRSELPAPQAEAWLRRARAMGRSLSATTIKRRTPSR